MNIDVPGRTGHNFPNKFDPETKIITWYGQPNTHSKQPIFSKIIKGKLKPHFFARWNQKDDFSYLGTGKILGFEDGHPTKTSTGKQTTTIQLKLSCEDSEHILLEKDSPQVTETSFALEKHLEEFIIENWHSLDLGLKYKLQEKKVDGKRKKFRTDTGEIDIFAISNDGKEHLVIELKRGRASDKVVGQILRYMAYIQDEVAQPNQKVRGLIIGLEDDLSLRRAISMVRGVDFNRYKIEFKLVSS